MNAWNEAARTEGGHEQKGSPRPEAHQRARRLAGLGLLVLLADLLFLDHPPGLSLAVFAVAFVTVAAATSDRGLARLGQPMVLILLVLAILPIVELVQPLSVLAFGLLLLAALVRLRLGPGGRVPGLLAGLEGLARSYPVEVLKGASHAVQGARRSTGAAPGRTAALLKASLLPLGAGLVLAGLLVAANPVLSLWMNQLGQLHVPLDEATRHAAFWVLAALLLWPLLAWRARAAPARAPLGSGGARLRLYPASVLATLALLNLLMGVQTVLDAGYLWGGVELPEGITHAEYARRGAYPLVATALLAGAFALVSRPFAEGRPALRALLGLWIAQNVLLVLSSLLRLDLYVEVWGLTRLRLAAAVWMGLVAGGLALTAWQVARGRSNGWLLGRVAAMAGIVLYSCCFASFGGIVARVNLDRFERTGALDQDYLCSLGAAALPALSEHEARTGALLCHARAVAPQQAEDWRDWGFRTWRLGRYEEARGAGGAG